MTFIDRFYALALLTLLCVPSAFASHVLRPQHQKVLDAWLGTQPNLRLATTADCGGCDDDVRQMRRGSGGVWKPVPDYHPYRAVGDFNGDGKQDFCVVLIDTTKKNRVFVLVIFNGPFPGDAKGPAFLEGDLDLRHQGLFFGPPRPKPFRLVVGSFESEGALLTPKDGSYKWSAD